MKLFREFIRFFLDKRILVAIGILFSLEIVFQLGLYKPYLKKNSYAANINRVTSHVLNKREELDPNLLVVGTSVAFEGISVRILNEELANSGWKVQSLAIRGSELVVQQRLLEEHLQKFPNVKVILHVLEPGMAWVDREELVDPTLSMLSELGNFSAIRAIHDFEYKTKWSDYSFLVFKSVAYRKDLADFIINFNERMKNISRVRKNPNPFPWDYENYHKEAMTDYQIVSIEDCLNRLAPKSTNQIPASSNVDHRRMLFETCGIAHSVPKNSKATPETDRYFRRLKKLYSFISKNNIKIIDVFAPYSDVIRKFNNSERMKVWEQGITKALEPHQTPQIWDLQDSLGKDTSAYSFDLIHLNEMGMKAFSKILAKQIREQLGQP